MGGGREGGGRYRERERGRPVEVVEQVVVRSGAGPGRPRGQEAQAPLVARTRSH
jgi:hypothetical protein